MVHVIQVDDDPIFNVVIHKHFAGRNDVDMLQMTSITALEHHIRSGLPLDVLLLDLSLPDRDAIEFLSAYKSFELQCKIIIITSQPRSVIDMAVTLAKAAGAEISLTLEKPMTPDKLAKLDGIVASAS